MTEVQILKLTTGEELLCSIVSKSESDTVAKHPILIIRGAEEQLSFAPYMPFADIESLTINSSSIMFACTPTEKLSEAYLQMTGEIIVPPQKIIV